MQVKKSDNLPLHLLKDRFWNGRRGGFGR